MAVFTARLLMKCVKIYPWEDEAMLLHVEVYVGIRMIMSVTILIDEGL